MAETYVIAAGGTAGHVVPALAVAAELRAEGARVVFVGGERAEAELVPKAGYELRTIAAEGLSRTNPLRAARAALKAGAAVATADRILGELRPDAVMGGGGYVAGPVGLAAVRRRIPLVLTEADSHLGLANRMLARFAARVCLGVPDRGAHGARYRLTGRPRPAAGHGPRGPPARASAWPKTSAASSSSGARSARATINEAAIRAFPGPEPRVLHAAGRRDVDALRPRVPGPHYELHDYLEPFGQALAAADLCVARAGGSIFEIAAHGRPAILVPYPHASADHQTGNARWMADAGAAVVIPDAELTPERLAREVGELLGDESRLAAMAEASARLAHPQAARDVAAELRRAAGRSSEQAEDHADHDRSDDEQRRGQGGPGAGAVGRHGDSNGADAPRLRPLPTRVPDARPWAGRRLHLIGIGGAGMSGYARVAAQLGARVSGSDRSPDGPVAESLRELGVDVRAGHAAEHVPAGDDVEVVYSSAVRPTTPSASRRASAACASTRAPTCCASSAASSARSRSRAPTARPRRPRWWPTRCWPAASSRPTSSAARCARPG
jgi:UDP-N-acetylglucosamine--N-acetylmuramyl-(pentapeptide) pyrophosphoryl-undecaprenol N-acetylglucosamine transferase